MTDPRRQFLKERADNILSYSGGKDSTACYLKMQAMGLPFRAVMWDTGNEHELTLEYAATLHRKTGGPQVEIRRVEFSEARFERRRKWIAENWPQQGIPQEIVDRAIACTLRTGVPFLDLCILKGRFPSRRAQFCTEELKVLPMESEIIVPASQEARGQGKFVVSWLGVRADESPARRAARAWEWGDWGTIKHRPIVHWSASEVFEIHARHGVSPNPLYSLGCNRVGCMPCCNVSKGELANIAARWPEHIDRLEEWESLVRLVSKLGGSTFLPAPDRSVLAGAGSIREHVAWSKTSRGGVQYDLEALLPPLACQSNYGLCE